MYLVTADIFLFDKIEKKLASRSFILNFLKKIVLYEINRLRENFIWELPFVT